MPTALIVEDEPEANKLLAMLVQLRGYSTVSAYSGAEALEKVVAHVPDVVFLDLMLPDRDGYDICRILKASGNTSQVPVVIVTARIAADNRIESFRAGADDYVPKPYTPDQIFEALEESNVTRVRPSVDGEVVLDGRDDGQTLRQLARLRSSVQARYRLETDAIDRLSTAIKTIWSSADRWGRKAGIDRVATLAFSLADDSLRLTVHDEGGWLANASELVPDSSSILGDAGFDQILYDREGRSLTLVKRFEKK
jgi:DNA-binding response OmpR family regulator